jgi:hypothetical protein
MFTLRQLDDIVVDINAAGGDPILYFLRDFITNGVSPKDGPSVFAGSPLNSP